MNWFLGTQISLHPHSSNPAFGPDHNLNLRYKVKGVMIYADRKFNCTYDYCQMLHTRNLHHSERCAKFYSDSNHGILWQAIIEHEIYHFNFSSKSL